ncbi:hypothetical protein [Tahibacter harae]|uniref:Uncharacterized protein n=1 Tax=Tahibacter harae TaxID=2963937 RepID=A0ABT1QMS8_9GAMM|nr:hypothetical protein [Tahibacter harae]MCQ4163836.1 hypothetical protein [Tahibacter harae]
MSQRRLLPETAPPPPRNRRRPPPPAVRSWPALRSWPLQVRAVQESVGLVLVSLLLSAGLFWLLALR